MTAIAILDRPDSEHGRLMLKAAQIGTFVPRILWRPPDLDLPGWLPHLEGVVAVAIPFGVVGGHAQDGFTMAVLNAILECRTSGKRVFVAAGNDAPNALALAGIPVAPLGASATVKTGSARFGSSGACVRAAAIAALFACKPHRVIAPPRSPHGKRRSQGRILACREP